MIEGRRSRLVLAVVAALVVAAGAAQASPAARVLNLSDPAGDSSSANRGHDIRNLRVSTGVGPGGPRLVVRLDLAGPVPSENTLHEVTFKSGNCLVHLGYGRSSKVPAGVPLSSSAAETPVYDCGATTPAVLFADPVALLGEVSARGNSITWTIVPGKEGLRVGSLLTQFRAYASVADELRYYWASQTDGVGSYDSLRNDTATYRFG